MDPLGCTPCTLRAPEATRTPRKQGPTAGVHVGHMYPAGHIRAEISGYRGLRRPRPQGGIKIAAMYPRGAHVGRMYPRRNPEKTRAKRAPRGTWGTWGTCPGVGVSGEKHERLRRKRFPDRDVRPTPRLVRRRGGTGPRARARPPGRRAAGRPRRPAAGRRRVGQPAEPRALPDLRRYRLLVGLLARAAL